VASGAPCRRGGAGGVLEVTSREPDDLGVRGREEGPVRPVQVRAARLLPLQDGELVAQIKISAVCHTSSRRDSRSHEATRVIRRNLNRRHMTGDHHRGWLGEQLCWSEPRTGFSARTDWAFPSIPHPIRECYRSPIVPASSSGRDVAPPRAGSYVRRRSTRAGQETLARHPQETIRFFLALFFWKNFASVEE